MSENETKPKKRGWFARLMAFGEAGGPRRFEAGPARQDQPVPRLEKPAKPAPASLPVVVEDRPAAQPKKRGWFARLLAFGEAGGAHRFEAPAPEVLAPPVAARPQPAPAPALERAPAPAPRPEPAPAPVVPIARKPEPVRPPEPVRAPEPAPEPVVEAPPEPAIAPVAEAPIVPEPAPAPVVEAPAPVPEPVAEPEVAPEPEPVVAPTPEPEPEPTPAPAPAPEIAPEPEPVAVEEVAPAIEAATVVAETIEAPPVETVEVEAVEAEEFVEEAPAEPALSWWQRLKAGLARSSSSIGQGIADVFTKRKLDDTSLEDLEDILVRADLGVAAATRIVDAISAGRFDKEVSPDEVKQVLAAEIEKSLVAVAKPLVIDATKKPFVVLVVGVNGSGKTTTIAKLTRLLRGEGRSVLLAAGDTFRAAAIEQLKVWGDRLGAPVISRPTGADAAGLAFDALTEAKATNADVVLMDTAGRLQNRTELMAELEKIIRVMKKVDSEAPHCVLLVLDATVGQNALSQVEIFGRVAGVTGLVMTKLDGTARGGILVALADKFKLPVHFIGVGETADDIERFEARDFARAIAGLEEENA